jgi:hypothetical protein
MPAHIRIAARPDELDALFRTRALARREQAGRAAQESEARLLDRFDAFPGTVNLAAFAGEELVGGLRLCLPGAFATPLAHLPDLFAPLPKGARAGCLDRFHLLAAHRDPGLRLGFSLLYMAAWCAVRRGVGYLAISPEPGLARTAQSLGFQQVGPRFQTEDGLEALPMLLDLGQIRLPLVDLARKQGVFEIFEGIEWACYRAGEPIVLAGEEGQAAYMVVTGEVIVSAERGGPSGRSAFKLATLGAGQLFGELALLTGRRRTASVVAATDADVLVLSRQVFRRELLERPDRLLEILERLAGRLADADDLLTR